MVELCKSIVSISQRESEEEIIYAKKKDVYKRGK